MLQITDYDFQRLANYVKKFYGIDLLKKKQLVSGRLSNTVIASGMKDFGEYVDSIVKEGRNSDIQAMLNRLTTNYTYFMREKDHFDYFKNVILPYLIKTKKNKVLSIWSAGCSSGEEPYTISMIIKEYLGTSAGAWDTRVLATDISYDALRSAYHAVYDEKALSALPKQWQKKYFCPTSAKGIYSVSKELKSNVIFREFNLMEPIRFKIKFDVIFCRNVMIYFDQQTKDALVGRFFQATNPGGYLLIGHSESLNKEHLPYAYIQPAIYRKTCKNEEPLRNDRKNKGIRC